MVPIKYCKFNWKLSTIAKVMSVTRRACPYNYIYGHTFFGNISVYFRPISMKFCRKLQTQNTIIYRLVMRHLRYTAYFSIFIFGPVLVEKWTWPPLWRQRVWVLKTQIKWWLTWWIIWVSCYLEIMFSKFSGSNTLPTNETSATTFCWRNNYVNRYVPISKFL